MTRQYSVVCEDDVAEEIDDLAREHGMPQAEVIRQLISLGLDEVD